MSLAIELTVIAALVLSIFVPGIHFIKGEQTKGRFKSHLLVNVFAFFGILLIGTVATFAGGVNVQAADGSASIATGLGYIAAALSTGVSCLGGGIAVASAASAALGAISEDQSILGKSLIYVGLAEGVCLYGLIISFMILGNL